MNKKMICKILCVMILSAIILGNFLASPQYSCNVIPDEIIVEQ